MVDHDDSAPEVPAEPASLLGPRTRTVRTYRPFARQRLRELDEWLAQQRGGGDDGTRDPEIDLRDR